MGGGGSRLGCGGWWGRQASCKLVVATDTRYFSTPMPPYLSPSVMGPVIVSLQPLSR